MPVIPLERPSSEYNSDRGLFEDIAFGLKSIPHLVPALTRGMDEEGITDEERELRKRSLSEAAQLLIPAVVTGGVGLTIGKLSPIITAIVGAASEGIGSGVAAKLYDEPVLPAAAFGAAVGGAVGAVPMALAGRKIAAEVAEGAGKATLDPRITRTAAGTVELSDVPYKVPTPEELPPVSPFSDPEHVAEFRRMKTMLTGRSFVSREPTQLPLWGSPERTQIELFGPGYSGKPLRQGGGPTLPKPPAALSGIESNLISDVPARGTPSGIGPGFSPDQAIQKVDETVKATLLGTIGAKVPKIQIEGWSEFYDQATSLFHRALAPARTTLMRMGEAGGVLAKGLDEAFVSWRMRSGEDVETVRNILRPFKTKEDRVHIGEVMEGLAIPKSPDHAAAADALSEVYQAYGQEAHGMGMREYFGDGDIRDFALRRNYLTHYYDPKVMKRVLTPGTNEYRHAMAWIKGHNQAKTEAEARSLLHQALNPRTSEFRTGPINFPRSNIMAGLPYEKDPLKVMTKYIYTVRKRLEVARKFGARDEGAKKLFTQILDEGGEKKVAERIYAAFNDALPQEYSQLVKAAGTYNVLTMLSTSGLVQPAQLINTASVTGYGNLIKAMGMLQRRESHEWARRTGAYVHETLQELSGFMDPETSLSQKWIRDFIFLEPLDKANRVVSALAGRLYATELAEKFATKQTRLQMERLIELGLDPAQVLAQKGVLTDEQLRLAAFTVSNNTQFGSSVLDLPELRNSAAGRLAYQFKAFALQQTQFLFDSKKGIFTKFRKGLLGQPGGDVAPMLRFAAGIGPAGHVLGTMVRGFKGKPEPDDERLKFMENLALVGSFGVFYDTWTSMERGPGSLLSMLAGPTAGEVTSYLTDVQSLAKGDPHKLLRHVVRRLPGIGQPLANYWLYPRE